MLLPSATDYTGAAVTQGGKKTFMTKFHDFIDDIFPGLDSSDKSALRAALGVPADQWKPTSLVPTYVSGGRVFTLSGDQTAEFHVGRRMQVPLTAGAGSAVYGTVRTSVYSAGTAKTSVTLDMDGAGALDATMGPVSLGILRADRSAIPAMPGQILQIVCDTDNATISHANPGYQALSSKLVAFTPKSTNSKIIIEVFGQFAQRAPSAGEFYTLYCLFDSSVASPIGLSTQYTEDFTGLSTNTVPGVLTEMLDNTTLTTKQLFVGAATTCISCTAYNLRWRITEIQK